MNRTQLCFDCKHKHMKKSGASPDTVGVLHRLLLIEFHGFTGRMDFYDSSLFGSWYYLKIFREGMGLFKLLWLFLC